MEGTMATIMMFAGNFAPLYWGFCDGSLQSIANNTALFSLLGTTYGGDGQTTFALPDLRGRAPIGTGANYQLGEMTGTETVTMTTANLPSHNHGLKGSASVSTNPPDGSNDPTKLLTTGNIYTVPTAQSGGPLAGVVFSVNNIGSSRPISIVQPYLAINYIICMEGIYPSRS